MDGKGWMSTMKRNPFYDNARVILIFLVVFGHMIQPFIESSGGVHMLYMWIYTFHMPAFIMLAGFFAKGYGSKDYILNLAKKLLLPYLIFQVAYTLFYYWIGKESWYNPLWDPHWSLWFLVSLFCWHVLLSLYKKLSPKTGITLAVVIGLFVGYIDFINHTFSLSRTFFFFPFFLIGYWLSNEQMMRLKTKEMKVASVAIMLAVAIILFAAPNFDVYWLLGSKPYSELGLEAFGAFARLLVYIGGFVMMMSVLAWVPSTENALTYIGSRTLYVYLLHGFIIQFFRENEMFAVNSVFDIIGLAALSAAIVLLLSSRWMMGIFQPLVEGNLSIIKESVKQRRTRTEP